MLSRGLARGPEAARTAGRGLQRTVQGAGPGDPRAHALGAVAAAVEPSSLRGGAAGARRARLVLLPVCVATAVDPRTFCSVPCPCPRPRPTPAPRRRHSAQEPTLPGVFAAARPARAPACAAGLNTPSKTPSEAPAPSASLGHLKASAGPHQARLGRIRRAREPQRERAAARRPAALQRNDAPVLLRPRVRPGGAPAPPTPSPLAAPYAGAQLC